MVFPSQPEGLGGQTPALIARSPIPSLSLGPHTSFKLTRQESFFLSYSLLFWLTSKIFREPQTSSKDKGFMNLPA